MSENIWICGNVGAGKTFLAQSIGRKAQEKFSARLLFASAQEILRWGNREKPNSLFEDAKVRGLTILDDLDKLDPRFFDRFYELMEARYLKALPTVITANSTARALYDFFLANHPENPGLIGAAFDRMNPCLKIELRGKSLRPDIDA